MTKTRLQLLNLVTWLSGFVALLGLLLTAHLKGLDGYRLNEEARAELGRHLSDPDIQASRLQAFSAKSTDRAAFKQELEKLLPALQASDIDRILVRARQERPFEFMGGFARTYSPWMLVMVTGFLAAPGKAARLPRERAWFCLVLSFLLQCVFLVFVVSTFFSGTADVGGTDRIENVAAMATVVVGVVSEFIYGRAAG